MSGLGNRDLSGLRFILGSENYQFITTTKTPDFLQEGDSRYYFGSGVSLPLPKMTAVSLKPKPIGSTQQRPPEGTPNAWTYIEAPTTFSGIPTVYNTLLKKKFSYLSYGKIPEFHRLVAAQPTKVSINTSLLTSLMSKGIAFLGSKMVLGPDIPTLIEAEAKLVKSTAKPFPIVSNDYVTQACLQKASSLEYGDRSFVILANADGSFQAIPVSAPVEFPNTSSEFVDPIYVKSSTPSYPAWVFPFVNFRSINESTGHIPLNPLYEWSFNSTGTRAIAMLVQRTPLAGNLKLLDLNRSGPNVMPDDRIYEGDTGQSVKVNANTAYFGSGEAETVQEDQLGLVELQFNLSLTGRNLEDFTFSVTVLRNEPPIETTLLRMKVAYAMPMLWTNGVHTDDVLDLCLELKETVEAGRYRNMQDGVYGLETPQTGRWSIRYNETELLSFPSHALVKSDDGLPIEYCSLQDMALAEHYQTQLVDLDLKSLSFHRKVKVRLPELTFIYLDWTTLYKKTATRIDTFIFGVLENTATEGHAEAIAKIDPYLNSTFDEVFAISSTFTTTLRARYYNLATQPLMLAPWWGEVLRVPITSGFIESLHKDVDETCGSSYPGLSTLTEENFSTWMNLTYTFDDGDPDYSGSSPGYGVWPCEAMLLDANPEFLKSVWDTDITWFLWRCVERARQSVGGSVLGDEYNRIRHAIAAFHSCDGGVYDSIEPWILLDLGRTKMTADHLVVRDYPIGMHWFIKIYKKAMVNTLYDGFMTHPNQHYSIFYKDEAYEDVMPEMEIGADTLYPDLTQSVMVTFYGNFSHSGTVPSFSATALKPIIVDKISFWDHTLDTSHVALHNQAFDRTEDLADYYPTSAFDVETTASQEPILIVNGLRSPCNYWNNAFFRSVLSATANTSVKDETVAVAHSRIAPLWG